MIIAKGPKAAKKVLPLVTEPLPIFKGIIVVNCHTYYNYTSCFPAACLRLKKG